MYGVGPADVDQVEGKGVFALTIVTCYDGNKRWRARRH